MLLLSVDGAMHFSPARLRLAPRLVQVNTAPFEGGWMIKVKLANTKELDDLMEPAAYSAFCESGGH